MEGGWNRCKFLYFNCRYLLAGPCPWTSSPYPHAWGDGKGQRLNPQVGGTDEELAELERPELELVTHHKTTTKTSNNELAERGG